MFFIDWNSIKPRLIMLLERTRAARAEEHRRAKQKRRMPSLITLWPTFSQTYLAEERVILPLHYIANTLESLRELMEDEGDHERIEMTDLVSRSTRIIHDLAETNARVRAELANCPRSAPSPTHEEINHPSMLFYCNRRSAYTTVKLMTFDTLLRHKCSNVAWKPGKFRHTPELKSLAEELLRALNWKEGADIKDFDDRLRCECGHPSVVNRPIDFVSLVRSY